MLPRLYARIDGNSKVYIRKFEGSTDVSSMGAFRLGSIITLEMTVERTVGMTTPVLRIRRDGEQSWDIPMLFKGSDNIRDVYVLNLDTRELCGEDVSGLFYYSFLLVRGAETLYTDTYNNCDFSLSDKEGSSFRLLIYREDFKTPESFGRGVMYQIFPDRFFRGESEKARNVPLREDAILNQDWENGIPQFATRLGDPLENNVFFGGTLWGVAEKLDYLESLGVSVIYLCPIFEAYSNHKYDTGNYLRVDEMFGGDEALESLIDKAKQRNIRIVLDGVFNHTGDDSIYFNRRGRYGEGGAYNDKCSPYFDWYNFREHPDDYESWWGIEIMPRINHSVPACRRFFTGEGGVIQKYIDMGIGGWRLDVADELCDEFLDELRYRAKLSDSEAVIIGEVWENAADKCAYGKRRRYFQGEQLDSVMNYPLRSAILSFCLFGDGETLYNTLVDIYSSYPREVSDCLMNIIGTHDTERIFTVLGRDVGDEDREMTELSRARLSKKQRERALRLHSLAAVIQYTVYGIPSIYYGDEVALEGYRDPFCRMPFPWHELCVEHREKMLELYRALGRLRKTEPALDRGEFYILEHTQDFISYVREHGGSRLIVCANKGDTHRISLPCGREYIDVLTDTRYREYVDIEPDGAMILKEI